MPADAGDTSDPITQYYACPQLPPLACSCLKRVSLSAGANVKIGDQSCAQVRFTFSAISTRRRSASERDGLSG